MKKILFALAILIMVTIPAALAADVSVPAKEQLTYTSATATATTTSAAAINLTAETVSLDGFTVKGYSVNGGSKWVAGSLPTGDALTKLIDKGMTLWVTNEMDGKAPKKATDTSIIKFSPIEKRSKANPSKLKPFYTADGNWTLSTATSLAAHVAGTAETYEYGESSDGKKASSWSAFTPQPVAAVGSTKKVYLFRIPAREEGGKYYPASKAWKVTPAIQGKAPKLKVDYKKEILKIKKGMQYATLSSLAGATATSVAESWDVSAAITANETIYVRVAATGKKPATKTQVITLATRATAPSGTIGLEKGKLKDDNLKNYEANNGSAWKKLAKPSGATVIDEVRIKATAKPKVDSEGNTTNEGNAASLPVKLTITWGPYPDQEVKEGGTAKEGVTGATFG